MSPTQAPSCDYQQGPSGLKGQPGPIGRSLSEYRTYKLSKILKRI